MSVRPHFISHEIWKAVCFPFVQTRILARSINNCNVRRIAIRRLTDQCLIGAKPRPENDFFDRVDCLVIADRQRLTVVAPDRRSIMPPPPPPWSDKILEKHIERFTFKVSGPSSRIPKGLSRCLVIVAWLLSTTLSKSRDALMSKAITFRKRDELWNSLSRSLFLSPVKSSIERNSSRNI